MRSLASGPRFEAPRRIGKGHALNGNRGYRQYPSWIPYVFIAPFFLGFAVFTAAPILYSFAISLTEWSGFGRPKFIGLANYGALFRDPLFITSLRNTFVIVVFFIPMIISMALVAAYLLHMGSIRGIRVFQTLYFLPYITTPVAVGMLFRALFNWQYGFINALLLQAGLIAQPVNWLNTPGATKPIIAIMVTWQSVGYAVVMLMAGLRGISAELFEAAKIDGASNYRIFWRIVVPLLKPLISFLVLTLMIWGLQLFDETYLLYGVSGGHGFTGGPEYSALTMVSYLYTTAFTDGYTGYGATLGYALAIVIVASTLVLRRTLEWKEEPTL